MRLTVVVILYLASFCLAQPAAPRDAQYTIFCQRITGPGHIEVSNQVKQQLLKTSRLRDWFVIHNSDDSIIYHGYYKTYDPGADKNEASRAQADRKAVELLNGANGERLFAQSMFVPLSSPDPAAPPEWNLVNAKGAYTIQIGVYKDHPDRKQIAVEVVREARKQGVEAYYYHGEVISAVCIGTWPATAVTVIDPTADLKDSHDTTSDLIVTPGLPIVISKRIEKELSEDSSKKFLEPTMKILDPTLADAFVSKYPEHHINGELEMIPGGKQPKHSILVEIPRAQDQAAIAAEEATPNLDQLAPTGSGKKTAEKKPKLKSLDDK